MSLLLQALLGANVDGSGLSLHVDGRTSRETCDFGDLPIAVGAKKVAKEGQKHGWVGCTVSSCFILGVSQRELRREEPKLSKIPRGHSKSGPGETSPTAVNGWHPA